LLKLVCVAIHYVTKEKKKKRKFFNMKRRNNGSIASSTSTYMRGGQEYEDTGLNYLVMYDSGEYSVVTEREIFLDPSDVDRAKVYHKNKPYAVEIIKKGTYEKIKEKEAFFRNKLSVNTSEEESSKKILKERQDLQTKSRLKIVSESDTDADVDNENGCDDNDDDFMGNGTSFLKQKKAKTLKESLPSYPFVSNINVSVQPSSSAQTSSSSAQTSSSSAQTQRPQPQRPQAHSPQAASQRTRSLQAPNPPTVNQAVHPDSAINAAIQEMQTQIAFLSRQNVAGANVSRFVVTGVDGKTKNIVEEIFGKIFCKWMLAVSAFMFTEDELMNSTLLPTNRTSRDHLDEEKVLLMRDALIFKYKFDNQALDKAWSAIAKSINNKGRNIKLKRRTRALFSRMRTSISRTFSSNAVSNEQ
jgi:hypothetical protein